MGKNRYIWENHGIVESADAKCDEAMKHFMEGVRIAGDLSELVLEEAIFQVMILPKRGKEAQKQLTWIPPKEDENG
jgi:hypothetical protein